MKKKTKIFIALPVAVSGNVNVEIITFLLQASTNYDLQIGIEKGNQTDENRNKLVNRFLETDYEWIFFIDTDTVPPDNALDMTKHKVDICSGLYYTWINKRLMPLIYKTLEYGYVPSNGRPTKIKNLVEIDATGAGCLLINRKVFNKIEKPYFLTPYDDKGITITSEDIYFFRKVKEVGYKIFMDKNIIAKHIKTIDLAEVAEQNYSIVKMTEQKGGNNAF